MAKATKRWAVREPGRINVRFLKSDCYLIFVGRKPRIPAGGYWPEHHWRIPPEIFEKKFPERYHLKCGGGPVEIEFKEP